MLTAREDDLDQILGLSRARTITSSSRSSALARIRALLRRHSQLDEPPCLAWPPAHPRRGARGREVDLTTMEFEMLGRWPGRC